MINEKLNAHPFQVVPMFYAWMNCAKQSLASKKINESHPQFLIDLLGGMAEILKIPEYDLKGKIGSTGNIDFKIDPLSMSNPVMRGYDEFGRAFYLAKITEHRPVNSSTDVVRIFQRSPGSTIWESTNGNHGNDIIGKLKESDMPEEKQLGKIGFSYFARIVTDGKVGRPKFNSETCSYTEPSESDEYYYPIYLCKRP